MSSTRSGASWEPVNLAAEIVPNQPDRQDRLDVVTASQITPTYVRYLWDQRIPLGAATLIPGEEGSGKTTVGVRLMADITRGTLLGEFSGTPRDVIILATEDGLESVVIPRLTHAGADLDRVHIVRARFTSDGSKRDIIIPDDLDKVGELAQETRAVFVWVDSLVTTLPEQMKTISYKETSKLLKVLGQWAEEHDLAVAAPWHLNKTAGSDTALRIMDSRAFRTSVRSMLLVAPDPDAPEGVTQGIVALDKANGGTLDVPALRYRIRRVTYEVRVVDPTTGELVDRIGSCGVADWVGELPGDGRQAARDALTPRVTKEGSPTQWLRNYLTDVGEAPREDVVAAAGDAGISLSALKRAAAKIGVVSRDQTGRNSKGTPFRRAIWTLPSSRPTQSVHTHPTGLTGPTGESVCEPTGLSSQVSSSRPSWPSQTDVMKVGRLGEQVGQLGTPTPPGDGGETVGDGETVASDDPPDTFDLLAEQLGATDVEPPQLAHHTPGAVCLSCGRLATKPPRQECTTPSWHEKGTRP